MKELILCIKASARRKVGGKRFGLRIFSQEQLKQIAKQFKLIDYIINWNSYLRGTPQRNVYAMYKIGMKNG